MQKRVLLDQRFVELLAKAGSDPEETLHMGIKALMGQEILFDKIVDAVGDNPRLHVCSHFLKRNREKLREVIVMICLQGDQEFLVVSDILALEFELLNGVGAFSVNDADAF